MKTAVLAGWEALSPADRAPYEAKEAQERARFEQQQQMHREALAASRGGPPTAVSQYHSLGAGDPYAGGGIVPRGGFSGALAASQYRGLGAGGGLGDALSAPALGKK